MMRCFLFIAATLAFLIILAIILWFGDNQPFGMIRHWSTEWPIYTSRLWPLLAVLIASLGFVAITANTLPPLTLPWRSACALFVFLAVALSLLTVWGLRAFPNSGDEYAYIFQARTFLSGRLWNEVPPDPDLFAVSHVFAKDGRWISEYPPGWPGLLTIFGLGHLPFWLVNPLLGGLLLISLAAFCRYRSGPTAAVVAVALMGSTPFFLFNAASYFSQVPAALFGLLFCHQSLRWLDMPRARTAISSGAALGMLGLIRPFDVVFFAAPFAVEFVLRARRAHWSLMPVAILGGLPFLALYLGDNAAVTGNPLLPIVEWGSPLLQMGTHPIDEFGIARGLSDALRLAVVHLLELTEWTSPLLVIAYPAALLAMRRALSFSDFIFPATVVAYLFYPGFGGNEYGPRYYFEAFPLLVMTVALATANLLGRARWRSWIRGLLLAHVLLCLVSFVICGVFFRRIVDERMDLQDQAGANGGPGKAVIVVRSGTGIIRHMAPLDLVRNGTDLSGDVVFAHDLPGGETALLAIFPDRKIYLYRRDPGMPRGTLTAMH